MVTINYLYDDSSDTLLEVIARCQRYDYASFNASSFHNAFSVLHLNIRSVTDKIDELNVWLSKLVAKPDVICLSETWSHVASPTLTLLGYNIVSIPRSDRRGGGVCVCIDTSMRYDIHIAPTYTTFECAIVSLNKYLLC